MAVTSRNGLCVFRDLRDPSLIMLLIFRSRHSLIGRRGNANSGPPLNAPDETIFEGGSTDLRHLRELNRRAICVPTPARELREGGLPFGFRIPICFA